jgi:hypothetical protein
MGRFSYPTLWRPISIFLMVLLAASTAAGRIIYVDDDATSANDGSSWTDAYQYLQDALADANSAEKLVEIRVAQGIYKPDQGANQTPGDREATFRLINGVVVNGGFAGVGAGDPNARDITLYETILSGDLNGNDLQVGSPGSLWADFGRNENSYHVVTGSATEPNAVLEGFTITGGYAPPPSSYRAPSSLYVGGGMYNVSGSPTVADCNFVCNLAGDGGGMYNDRSSPTLRNCVFTRNVAAEYCEFSGDLHLCIYGHGGAIHNFASNPTLTNCKFIGNFAASGGGVYNEASSPIITNCTFAKNQAGRSGGGMKNVYSCPAIRDCLFVNNRAGQDGGGIGNSTGSNATLTNCLFNRNYSQRGGGGSNFSSGPRLTRCTFSGNQAEYNGGGIYDWEGSPTITNCVFSGNRATWIGGGVHKGGGAVYGFSSRPMFANCTFVGNWGENANALGCDFYRLPNEVQIVGCILRDGGREISAEDGSIVTVTHSDVYGGWPGEGNIDNNPCFADAGYWDPNGTPGDPNDDFWVDGDYHLKSQAGRWDPSSGSWVKDDVTGPCIDAGNPMSPIGQEPFPNGGIINMGAYGGTAEASKSYFGEPPCGTIIAGDINGDCKVDFRDFVIIALHWLGGNDE